MKLRRYRKVMEDGRYRMEECDTDDFVAFWSDTKYTSGRDRKGVEWLLYGGHSLLEIEKGTKEFTRISRATLVRTNDIESVRNVYATDALRIDRVFIAGGHQYVSSRRYRRGWMIGDYFQGCRRVA